MPDTVHHETTQQLIRDIESKDRRFRLAQSVFMVLLLFGFIAGGWFAAQAYQNEQVQRDAANKAVIDAINGKLDDQSKQLQCIVRFFTIDSTERDKSSIRSVDDCFTTDRTSARPQEGEQSSNFTPGSQEPLVYNPQSRPQGLQPVGPTPRPQPEPTPKPSDPVKILGIPVCVPLTDLCLR